MLRFPHLVTGDVMSTQGVVDDFRVLTAVRKAYAAPVRHFGQLVRMLWPWLLAMAPVLLLSGWLTWPLFEGAVAGDSTAKLALGWVRTVVTLPFLAGIAVAWHRLLLRGVSASGSNRIWAYMLSAVMLWAAADAAASLGYWFQGSQAPEGAIFAILALCVFTVLAVRMSLVLPAVAVRSAVSWGQVWKATSGYTWPIVFGALLAAGPILIAPFILGPLFYPEMTRITFMISEAVIGLAHAVLLVISVGYLSFAYQWFFEPADRIS